MTMHALRRALYASPGSMITRPLRRALHARLCGLLFSCSAACSDGHGSGATSGGSAGTYCQQICATTAKLGCPSSTPAATCIADCRTVADSPTTCPSQRDAFYGCTGDTPLADWACDAQGKANMTTSKCMGQLSAWQACVHSASGGAGTGSAATPDAGT